MSPVSNNNAGFAAKIFSLLGLVIIGFFSQQDKNGPSLPGTIGVNANISPAYTASNQSRQAIDSVVFVRTSVSTSQRSDQAPALAP